ncbi:MAG: HipA N-terminal domain-containing protein [Fidelibacterota bacterium]
MRRARVLVNGVFAGSLTEIEKGGPYEFNYEPGYADRPISLIIPIGQSTYRFERFPPFFDGLLPEGIMLEGLLRRRKIDQFDYFSQLVSVGNDLVGAVTVEEES